MIEPLGPNLGPIRPLPPQPSVAAPPPAPSAPPPPSRRLGVDSARFTRPGAGGLAPLPFDVGGALPDDAEWRDLTHATRQAGMGGLLDRLTRDVAARDPQRADGLPVLYDGAEAPASGRRTLAIAQRLAQTGFGGRGPALAALAAETAGPDERAVTVAAAIAADRAGGRAEASHALYRLAERARTPADALAAARRSVKMGYPENAKVAYHRAAELSADAAAAVGVAKEATAAGLAFEAGEPAFVRWRGEMDRLFKGLEGPPQGPEFRSASPYAPGATKRAAFVNPYMAALRKAGAEDLGAVARAATAAGESATAALAWKRVRESRA